MGVLPIVARNVLNNEFLGSERNSGEGAGDSLRVVSVGKGLAR